MERTLRKSWGRGGGGVFADVRYVGKYRYCGLPIILLKEELQHLCVVANTDC